MKAKSMSSMGSMHPLLFFVLLYVIALLFALFICSTLFYSCNAGSTGDPLHTHSELPLSRQAG